MNLQEVFNEISLTKVTFLVKNNCIKNDVKNKEYTYVYAKSCIFFSIVKII